MQGLRSFKWPFGGFSCSGDRPFVGGTTMVGLVYEGDKPSYRNETRIPEERLSRGPLEMHISEDLSSTLNISAVLKMAQKQLNLLRSHRHRVCWQTPSQCDT